MVHTIVMVRERPEPKQGDKAMFDTAKIENAATDTDLDNALNNFFNETGHALKSDDTYEESLAYLEQFSGANVELRCDALRKAIKRWHELQA